MNKKTDKLIDALGKLDEEQIASCMNVRRRGAFMQSGKARVALVLAAALLITTLASALIVLPMMLDNDNPGENPGITPGITTGNNDTAPNTDATTNPPVQPPENQAKYPGIAQLLSLGTISYSGYTVADDGVINLPSKNGDVSFSETDDYFTAPIPIITLNCGAQNTVKISCDYGVVGEVKRVREYGEDVYQYVDDNGGRWGISYCSHFGDNELTIKGNDSFLWYYKALHGLYNNTGCNRDTFIDYTVYNPDGEIIAAGSIYVAAFRYMFAHDLRLMTSIPFDRALSNFEIFEEQAAQYTVRKPINLYAESFVDENGVIDTEKRDAFFDYHETIKSVRSTLPKDEWINAALYPSEEDGYDISDLAREAEENWVNPYAYDLGNTQVKPTEQVLAEFDQEQLAYYQDYLERKAQARQEAENSFTSHDLLMKGFAKLCNDHIGFHPWSKEYSGGVSCGTMAIRSEYMVFEVRGYNDQDDTAGWWLVINDKYYEVLESSNEMHEGEDYNFIEHYILEDGIEVYFYFSNTVEDKIEVIIP